MEEIPTLSGDCYNVFMKELIDNIKQSIYGPDYYRAVLTEPMRTSWKYYSAFALLVAVILTIILSVPLVFDANKVAHDFPPKFFAYYPDELELTIRNGIVGSSVTEPYFLPVPVELRDIKVLQTLENVAVIDTKTVFSIEQFNAYNAMFWVGLDQVAYRDERGAIRIEPIDKNVSFVINEQKLRKFEERITPYYSLIGPIIVMAIFTGLVVAFGVNFIYLLFGALLIMFLGRFLKQTWSYGKAYQIGLHAITLSLLIDTFISILGLGIVRFPFASTIVMLLVVYVNFKDSSAVLSTPKSEEAKIIEG